MATTQENIAVSRRLVEDAFGKGDLPVIDEVCTERYVDHDPLLGDRGREDVKQTIAGYREAFPGPRLHDQGCHRRRRQGGRPMASRGDIRERVHGPGAHAREG